jgi:hypothetical protein
VFYCNNECDMLHAALHASRKSRSYV